MDSQATLPTDSCTLAALEPVIELPVTADPMAGPEAITRRRVLKTLGLGAAGMALWAGEVERHWIDITHRDIHIAGLPEAFDGMTIAQLSDIHLEEYTEPFLLREAVDHINRMNPDMVLLTGDYVSAEMLSKKITTNATAQCASLLGKIRCAHKYAILGNHDIIAGGNEVTEAIASQGIPVLRNGFMPIERGRSRIWLAGIDDPVLGRPDVDRTMPVAIRNTQKEPIILMCHAPDYVDELLKHPVSQSIALVLSGHTHGGQIRLPFVGAMHLPPGGRKYVQGWFGFGGMQLYVNRGIGSVGVPFRFDCRPEITRFRLRAGKPQPAYLNV
jgi:predicted MPP superfamily phosphohydrolase